MKQKQPQTYFVGGPAGSIPGQIAEAGVTDGGWLGLVAEVHGKIEVRREFNAALKDAAANPSGVVYEVRGDVAVEQVGDKEVITATSLVVVAVHRISAYARKRAQIAVLTDAAPASDELIAAFDGDNQQP